MAHSQLSQYEEKYKNRLKAKNLRYIKLILFIVNSFIKFLTPKSSDKSTQSNEETSSSIMKTNDFLFATQIDNLNIFKIEKYIQKSEIVKKLNGFFDKINQSLVQNGTRSKFYVLIDFRFFG